MKGNKYNHKLPSINVLRHQYWVQNMSSRDIAKKYNVTKGAVLIKFRRHDIKRRTFEESQALIANYIDINDSLKCFLYGLLLGDGSLVYAPNRKSCCYAHTDKNHSYLLWLKKQFTSFGIETSDIKPHTNNSWNIKTKWYRNFVELRREWYPCGKKKIPKIQMSPITLFNWYIGDGSFDKKSKSKKVVICSEFDQDGKQAMSDLINSLEIKTSVYYNCIYIKAESRTAFFNYITSHNYPIPKCYIYKFP